MHWSATSYCIKNTKPGKAVGKGTFGSRLSRVEREDKKQACWARGVVTKLWQRWRASLSSPTIAPLPRPSSPFATTNLTSHAGRIPLRTNQRDREVWELPNATATKRRFRLEIGCWITLKVPPFWVHLNSFRFKKWNTNFWCWGYVEWVWHFGKWSVSNFSCGIVVLCM